MMRCLLSGGLFFLVACQHPKKTEAEAPAADDVRTPVTVTEVATTTLQTYVDLNATSAFLQSNFIKATANGYIKQVHVKLGQRVAPGQTAFVIRTKEAEALGNTVNRLDPSFHFTGIIPIRVTAAGYIQELHHQPGDYVQDGEQLAVLTDANSFGFILNIPYELRTYAAPGTALDVTLPDGRRLPGKVARVLPGVDSVAQTQQVLLRVDNAGMLPQNLIGRVRITRSQKQGAQSLPKAAVLSDEAQENFWVMKMIDSITAVKVPVVRGMETSDRVEIVRPQFAAGDRIILTGNYGLPDTAKVIIQKGTQ
ncbi:HlyD family efflux transporter periplasmic adaptor subunit [Flaviaesturariibacter flavus]|uniref:HlyD family efflux transporter periplasmic adaptor subunit n=1 Tax=Flaviaesturariibacter flavus TaxID=2502780 RepID=A0A4R1BBZ1_9BACT|nr:efflux RND transporter periplasmic adaptor subunit [Flaviaesturariibacter flavus]TCJ14540.1 HlyD family efflux transporter periplasmic adaptor subunit [Flaviaesturariibacter flavus]